MVLQMLGADELADGEAAIGGGAPEKFLTKQAGNRPCLKSIAKAQHQESRWSNTLCDILDI